MVLLKLLYKQNFLHRQYAQYYPSTQGKWPGPEP